MARPGNYLHRRKGSKNWLARFRYTGKLAESMGTKLREISLGTADQREAENPRAAAGRSTQALALDPCRWRNPAG
jgi:hypothetical protein